MEPNLRVPTLLIAVVLVTAGCAAARPDTAGLTPATTNDRTPVTSDTIDTASTADDPVQIADLTNQLVRATADRDWTAMCSLFSPDVLANAGGVSGCAEALSVEPGPDYYGSWGTNLLATPVLPEHVHLDGDTAEVSLAEVTGQDRADFVIWTRDAGTWRISENSQFPEGIFEIYDIIP